MTTKSNVQGCSAPASNGKAGRHTALALLALCAFLLTAVCRQQTTQPFDASNPLLHLSTKQLKAPTSIVVRPDLEPELNDLFRWILHGPNNGSRWLRGTLLSREGWAVALVFAALFTALRLRRRHLLVTAEIIFLLCLLALTNETAAAPPILVEGSRGSSEGKFIAAQAVGRVSTCAPSRNSKLVRHDGNAVTGTNDSMKRPFRLSTSGDGTSNTNPPAMAAERGGFVHAGTWLMWSIIAVVVVTAVAGLFLAVGLVLVLGKKHVPSPEVSGADHVIECEILPPLREVDKSMPDKGGTAGAGPSVLSGLWFLTSVLIMLGHLFFEMKKKVGTLQENTVSEGARTNKITHRWGTGFKRHFAFVLSIAFRLVALSICVASSCELAHVLQHIAPGLRVITVLFAIAVFMLSLWFALRAFFGAPRPSLHVLVLVWSIKAGAAVLQSALLVGDQEGEGFTLMQMITEAYIKDPGLMIGLFLLIVCTDTLADLLPGSKEEPSALASTILTKLPALELRDVGFEVRSSGKRQSLRVEVKVSSGATVGMQIIQKTHLGEHVIHDCGMFGAEACFTTTLSNGRYFLRLMNVSASRTIGKLKVTIHAVMKDHGVW